MVFGYSTNAFVKFALTDAIHRIAALGFRGVEIMCDRPHLYPPEYDADALAEVRRAVSDAGLKITNLNGFTLFAVGNTHLPSWIESNESRRRIRIQHTLDCIRVAVALGCPHVSVPPGGPLAGMGRAAAVSLFYKGLEEVIPEAERCGVRLLIEPEPELLIENTAQAVSFMKEIRSPAVGINFDIGHFFCVGEDPSAAFETLARWVGHVHVEDIAATRAHVHLIPGQGDIAFQKVFETMARLGYAGDICLELYPCTDRPEAAGRESMVHLAPLLEAAGMPVT